MNGIERGSGLLTTTTDALPAKQSADTWWLGKLGKGEERRCQKCHAH